MLVRFPSVRPTRSNALAMEGRSSSSTTDTAACANVKVSERKSFVSTKSASDPRIGTRRERFPSSTCLYCETTNSTSGAVGPTICARTSMTISGASTTWRSWTTCSVTAGCGSVCNASARRIVFKPLSSSTQVRMRSNRRKAAWSLRSAEER